MLAFESSADRCEVALFYNGNLTALSEINPRGHATRLLPMADQLLDTAGLSGVAAVDRLAYDSGPGGFTGLRIAAAFVQGLAYAGGQPVTGIGSLELLAWQFASTEPSPAVGSRFACAIDARMKEVYWQVFEVVAATAAGSDPRLMTMPLSPAAVSSPADCLQACESLGVSILVGSGFDSAGPSGTNRFLWRELYPEARALAILASFDSSVREGDGLPPAAVPTYIRGASAWKRSQHRENADKNLLSEITAK